MDPIHFYVHSQKSQHTSLQLKQATYRGLHKVTRREGSRSSAHAPGTVAGRSPRNGGSGGATGPSIRFRKKILLLYGAMVQLFVILLILETLQKEQF